ncbi:adenine nucleotide alpha hydrolases-like protein [Annulohypoxylon maeteangense]|uniref:adenine nucleotide alpha hydrolases-like protein n=1 Tax=Annulohypoxylon maeteangense TaxID=1927788 RepID=UPI002008A102|nr:adenine nucleotide alpha hydrolases-like protein [Annulohypoxylon maeteangense]KAI0890555.1 adenine nucleotide alpha hydrolases-like protein [Annulohypoxylon maeteangense]
MAADDPLNVVALVSGGKDSFYSILHCLANGHRVIALANLHPPPPRVASTSTRATVRSGDEDGSRAEVDNAINDLAAIRISPSDITVAQHQHGSLLGLRADNNSQDDDEIDLNSFMYQTVGHQVIPLYAQATGLPLFRRAILGTAVDSGISYKHPDGHQEEDETESLVPLLHAVLKAHPEVNALCTGAILSTYQRTRVESVALRLGLIPLAFLWQFPDLPLSSAAATTSTFSTSTLQPADTDDAQLLRDMAAAGLVARIVKVASAGLGEEFLWENVASDTGISRIRRALRRFGGDGGRGAVLGEGGEFETLVVDGPPVLFKGRIVIRDDDKRVVREGGGSAWLNVREAQVEMKLGTDITSKTEDQNVRIPNLLDPKFKDALDLLHSKSLGYEHCTISLHEIGQQPSPLSLKLTNSISQDWYFVGRPGNIEAQTAQIVDEVRQQLHEYSLPTTAITNTIIVLRRMSDFPTVNRLYGALFREPNPPARVTISCGDLLTPQGADISILLTVQPRMKQGDRRGLHVQSRSYWAPANIGPYSQAITYPLLTIDEDKNRDNDVNSNLPLAVSIAGQIPLVPASMSLPSVPPDGDDNLRLQVTLALQHLWRVGAEMQVQWWSSAVAYFPRSPSTPHAKHCALLAASAWKAAHAVPSSASSDAEEGPDLWDRKYNPLYMTYGGGNDVGAAKPGLPDWEVLKDFDADDYSEGGLSQRALPFVFSAEVEELPRAAGVEWHAHLGFANVGFGDVRLYSSHGSDKDQRTAMHSVVVESPSGDVFVQTVAAYQDSDAAGSGIGVRGTQHMLRVVGQILQTSDRSQLGFIEVNPKLTYINSESFDLLGETESLQGKGAIIPCRSLWDSEARKLDMVVILESRWGRKADGS